MKIVGFGKVEQRRAYTGFKDVAQRIRINPLSIGKSARGHFGISQLIKFFKPGERVKITIETTSKEKYIQGVYVHPEKNLAFIDT